MRIYTDTNPPHEGRDHHIRLAADRVLQVVRERVPDATIVNPGLTSINITGVQKPLHANTLEICIGQSGAAPFGIALCVHHKFFRDGRRVMPGTPRAQSVIAAEITKYSGPDFTSQLPTGTYEQVRHSVFVTGVMDCDSAFIIGNFVSKSGVIDDGTIQPEMARLDPDFADFISSVAKFSQSPSRGLGSVFNRIPYDFPFVR